MPGREHHLITAAAIALLPEWRQALLGAEKANLIAEYCVYPDSYFDVAGPGHAKAAPYHFETDGVQFHYLPDTPIVDKYRYWRVEGGKLARTGKMDNLNWRHARNGFAYYLSRSVESLQAGRTKDALSFAGCLLHMLQDSCFALHSLEGPYGTDLFVLDRLFDCGDDLDKLPSDILAAAIPEAAATSPDYAPTSLGNCVEEAAFLLYSRYVATVLEARKTSFQIVRNVHDDKDTVGLYRKMFHNAVKLSADALNTILALAEGRHERMGDVTLSDLEPVERPWGFPGPYRFVTMLRDKALNPAGKIVPLSLIVDGEPRTFAKGLSFGSHAEFSFVYELPAAVYGKFSCRIGIHADYLESGETALTFLNNGEVVFTGTFNKGNPAQFVEIENPRGRFELSGTSPEAARCATAIVWAEPKLTPKKEET